MSRPSRCRNSDFPWNFYFNGEEMPRWGACWMSCDVMSLAHEELEARQEIAWADRLFRLYCRIDHVGIVESEDPKWFRASALLLLKHSILKEQLLIERAELWGRNYGNPSGATIISAIRDTLFRAERLTARDGYAAWTSGDANDQAMLCDHIHRAALTPENPKFLDWPHVSRDRSEAQIMTGVARKELMKLFHFGGLSKELRRALHAITEE